MLKPGLRHKSLPSITALPVTAATAEQSRAPAVPEQPEMSSTLLQHKLCQWQRSSSGTRRKPARLRAQAALLLSLPQMVHPQEQMYSIAEQRRVFQNKMSMSFPD